MKPALHVLPALLLALLDGCSAPAARLNFPAAPLQRSSQGWLFDVHGKGRADFALLPDASGKLDLLAYDDAGLGSFGRRYRLSEYRNADVPHVILLLDSIPYQQLREAYDRGRFGWFDPPVKVIAPFPSMTELIFTRMLGAPPLPGMIDQYYNPETLVSQNDLLGRVLADQREPWERRTDYCATMYQSALMYLDPRPWFAAELELAHQASLKSGNRVTLLYFSSASAMLSRYGKAGLDEVIDGVERLCLRILYERQGAVKISMCADHGHNLVSSTNVPLEKILASCGFQPSQALNHDTDVVLEINGLVTYAALRTRAPAAVSRAMVRDPRIDLAMFLDGERILVTSARGTAAVECRHHQTRYLPLDGDPLLYANVVARMIHDGQADPDGFATDDAWLAATVDHLYPDAPRRVWDALHGTVIHPPEVLLCLHDGYCAGNPDFERFIHMASTHGGLNQVNSATFLLTMTGRAKGPLRSKDILPTVEPGFDPSLQRR